MYQSLLITLTMRTLAEIPCEVKTKMKLKLKIVPGAAQDSIAGWLGDALKVRVRAPAEKGKANTAVEKLVASALKLPQANVTITVGKTSAHKIMEITGLSKTEVIAKLEGNPEIGKTR